MVNILTLDSLLKGSLSSCACTPNGLKLISTRLLSFFASSLTGFGLPLKSQAILTVQYGFGVVVNGAAYTTAQVASAPTVFVTPPGASSSQALYTLILADAASLGDPDVQGKTFRG